jgi:toxin FitB
VFLLDTNVVSELRRFRPHGAVVAWLNSVSKTSLRICAVTLGEIQRGIEMTRARDPAQAREIEIWADKLENSLAVIPADAAVFRRHARLMQRRSDSIYEDALIAATALVQASETGVGADYQSISLLIGFPVENAIIQCIRRVSDG